MRQELIEQAVDALMAGDGMDYVLCLEQMSVQEQLYIRGVLEDDNEVYEFIEGIGSQLRQAHD